MAEKDLLDTLLSTANSELEKSATNSEKRCLKEASIFNQESSVETKKKDSASYSKISVIHSGDTDSSDDEDNKYFEERKYNEYGKDIKHLLNNSSSIPRSMSFPDSSWKIQPTQQLAVKKPATKTQDVYTDPTFGIRIVNPLVSSKALQDRMEGREAVTFSAINRFLMGNVSDKNWVLAGVIVNKSAVKTSQKGTQFLIWSLSDLQGDIKTISMFLFGSAYKQLWKTAMGTVVGILNPSVLDKKSGSKDEACLSVDNAQKVMVLGQSKDFNTCKSVKKNGQQCTAIVNTSRCEYCVYHIKQEYQKCSKRSELQSSFAGRGLTALRNKVLGKNEIFYAGKSYTAIPAKRNKRLEQNDEGRLKSLSGQTTVSKSLKQTVRNKPKVASQLEVTHSQRLKDMKLLVKLGGDNIDDKTDFKACHSAEVTLESSKTTALSVIAKLKTAAVSNETDDLRNELSKDLASNPNSKLFTLKPPLLSGKETGTIDLGLPVIPKPIHKAKINALKYVEKNGPLTKSDPNSVKSSSAKKKRPIKNIENDPKSKKPKLENEFLSDRFKKMIAATSKHMDLLELYDNEEEEKYFNKLENKEKMEEQMINTHKVPCKAVRCLKCKYTTFSASQQCKDERHPLRVFDAMKRFYKCSNCGKRTVCLEIVPLTTCKNCGSGKWERTGMLKEKMVVATHTLSIRGGEQKFINSVATNDNIDLLVPSGI